MNMIARFTPLVAFAAFALLPNVAQADEVTSAVKVTEGKMLYGPDGQRLAPVYHVNTDGSVQIILNGRLVTIASSGVSELNGKTTASKSKAELLRAK
jgi:hypothetical protein